MTMRVEVDEPKCVAAGQCAMTAPEVFDQRDDDGIVVLLDAEPGAELHEAVRDSVALCPAAAIRLVEV
jgi:ferredoxin